MAFVTCEFSEELEDSLTFDRIKQSALITRCLYNDNPNINNYFDENFLISLVHLVLKTWIASGSDERKKYADPFSIFDQLLVPSRQSN